MEPRSYPLVLEVARAAGEPEAEPLVVDSDEWTSCLRLVATTDPALAATLQRVLPSLPISTFPPGADFPALVVDLERYLLKDHRLEILFDVDLPAVEHYLAFFALQRVLKRFLALARLVAAGSSYRSGGSY